MKIEKKVMKNMYMEIIYEIVNILNFFLIAGIVNQLLKQIVNMSLICVVNIHSSSGLDYLIITANARG